MKTIFRNLSFVLKRFKTATWLNIAGLSVAFAAFLIILMQVQYEYGFDRMHTNAGRTYRLNLESPYYSYILVRPLAESFINSSPHIEAGVFLLPFHPAVYFTSMENGEKKGFRENIMPVWGELTKVFDFDMVEGEMNALRDPEKVLIPQSLATRLYGSNSSPIGKVLIAEENIFCNDRSSFTIGGIYRDFPGNTQLNNDIYINMDDSQKENWNSSSYLCYVSLDDASSSGLVTDNFNTTFNREKVNEDEMKKMSLTPLTDIYFTHYGEDENIQKNGSKEGVLVLLFVAFLVIIIAAINFTNFSIALAPARIKSINTQKVLGGDNRVLQMGLLTESLGIVTISFIFALALVFAVEKLHVFSFIDVNLQLSAYPVLIVIAAAVGLLVAFVAGFYPARYMTSFSPALVLKGGFGLSPKGRKLRTTLIGLQFVISIVLIIAASFVNIQRSFMQNFQLGFDTGQIAVVELNTNTYNSKRDLLQEKLTNFYGVEEVAFAMEKLGSQDSYSYGSFRLDDESVTLHTLFSTHNILSVLGIEVEDGRDFLPSDEKSESMSLIMNKGLRDRYHVEAGHMVDWYVPVRVIGFVDNLKFNSIRQQDSNFAFVCTDMPFPAATAYIRLNAGIDHTAAISHIRNVFEEVDPGYPVQVEFYDTIFDQLYHKEESLNKIVSSFSLMAILISIIGVFGLVLFETQYRRKEVGVRKVMGAEVRDILVMFNKIYLHIVVICFIIATPIAYYSIMKWLENFAYKTPIYWWVFVLAFLVVSLITVFTVTFQNWKAANENPVNCLKTE